MNTIWWQQHWQSPVIASNNHYQQQTLFFWLLSITSAAACAYFLTTHETTLLAHYYLYQYQDMALMLLSMCIPALLLIVTIKKTYRNKKEKRISLTMDTFPAQVGNAFLGNIELPPKKYKSNFSAELILYKYIVNQKAIDNGKSKEQATTKTLWRMPITVRKQDMVSSVRLSLEARLPDNAPPSSPSTQNEYHEWQLHVFSANQGFQRTWDIPIVNG